MKPKKKSADQFTLYDLKVTTHANPNKKPMACNHPLGSHFFLRGENLILPKGQSFPIYSLAALIPLLPAKQRMTHENDWMSTDAFIACPDPNCGGLFKIERIGRRSFRHSETTLVPLKKGKKKKNVIA
ncbi:MAG: TIGR04076 family protein [Dongiaceae bacterium]